MADLTHNHSNRLYRIWASMKGRCYSPSHGSYKRYGAKGIKVCEKWFTFNGFYEDMVETYRYDLTIDRIDNNKGYFKENCRWATPKQQSNNRKNNRIIEFEGERRSLAQWAEFLGIKRSTLAQRFYVYRWSIQKCFIGGI